MPKFQNLEKEKLLFSQKRLFNSNLFKMLTLVNVCLAIFLIVYRTLIDGVWGWWQSYTYLDPIGFPWSVFPYFFSINGNWCQKCKHHDCIHWKFELKNGYFLKFFKI